jgi:hypothetical protein
MSVERIIVSKSAVRVPDNAITGTMTAQLFVGTTTGDGLAIVPVIVAVVLLVVMEGKK